MSSKNQRALSLEKQKLQNTITTSEKALLLEQDKLEKTAQVIQSRGKLLEKQSTQIFKERIELTKNEQHIADLIDVNKKLELEISILNEQQDKNFKFQLKEIAKTK